MYESSQETRHMHRLLAISGTASIAASLLMVALTFLFVPIPNDGAWYSYPAYAWSQGGDPSENIPGIARPTPAPNRPVATFNWENRSNLTVLFTAAWFKAFPPSWQSLKAFGLLQYTLLISAVALCVYRLTCSLATAFAAACITAADARVIAESAADARPDLPIAIVAIFLIAALTKCLREPLRPTTLIASAALCVILPLLHVTAAYTLTFSVSFLAFFALFTRRQNHSDNYLRIALVVTALLSATFFARQLVLDLVIPTTVPASVEYAFRHHLIEELRSFYNGNFPAKLLMELKRWRDYFTLANSMPAAFIALGIIVSMKALRLRTGDPLHTLTLSLAGAFVTAVVAIILTDSHPMFEHLLPLAVLAYVSSSCALVAARQAKLVSYQRLIQIYSVFLAAGAVVNVAHAVSLYRTYTGLPFSNHAQESVLLGALPADGDVQILAPTEIWPYLMKRKAPLLLADFNRSVFLENGGVLELSAVPGSASAHFLIVNEKEYNGAMWAEATHKWQQRSLITELVNLGNCSSRVQCLRIYAINR